MFQIIGIVLLFGLVFGSYIISGGNMGVIMHALPHEMMAIGGAGVAAFLISNSVPVIKGSLGGFFSDKQIVEMATINGAKILGWDAQVGRIRPGMLADLVVLDDLPGPADGYRNMINAVEAAMKRLPPELAEALLLYEVEGKAYKEIAQMLAIPIGTVRTRIFRAREMIAQRLERVLGPSRDRRW